MNISVPLSLMKDAVSWTRTIKREGFVKGNVMKVLGKTIKIVLIKADVCV